MQARLSSGVPRCRMTGAVGHGGETFVTEDILLEHGCPPRWLATAAVPDTRRTYAHGQSLPPKARAAGALRVKAAPVERLKPARKRDGALEVTAIREPVHVARCALIGEPPGQARARTNALPHCAAAPPSSATWSAAWPRSGSARRRLAFRAAERLGAPRYSDYCVRSAARSAGVSPSFERRIVSRASSCGARYCLGRPKRYSASMLGSELMCWTSLLIGGFPLPIRRLAGAEIDTDACAADAVFCGSSATGTRRPP